VVTSNPARRAGLQRSKGRLDVGMDADLLILNRGNRSRGELVKLTPARRGQAIAL